MKHKGNIWILIFFLIIIFLFTTTIDVNQLVSTKEDIEVRSTDNSLIKTKIKPSHSSAELPSNYIKYKEFVVEYSAPNTGLILFIDVNNRWMEYKRIDPSTIKIFNFDNESSHWIELPHDGGKVYATSTLYTISTVNKHPYIIAGEKDSLEGEVHLSYWQKVLLLLIIIIVLLFIGYYKPRKENQKNRKEIISLKQLEAYVKKSLMEGQKEEKLREQLISAGWDRKKIDRVMRKSRYF